MFNSIMSKKPPQRTYINILLQKKKEKKKKHTTTTKNQPSPEPSGNCSSNIKDDKS